MRRLITMLSLLFCLSALGGCAWWQKLQTDPVAAMQDATSYIRTAAGMARSAFEIWASASGDQGAAVRPQFNQIMGSVDQGLVVAQDGLRIAAIARGPAPDVNALLTQAQTAVGSLTAFLSGLPTGGPGRAADPTMRDAIQATQRAAMLRYPR